MGRPISLLQEELAFPFEKQGLSQKLESIAENLYILETEYPPPLAYIVEGAVWARDYSACAVSRTILKFVYLDMTYVT